MYKKYFLLLLVVVMVIWGIAPSALAQDESIRGIVLQIEVSGDGSVMAVSYRTDNAIYPIDFFDTETLLLLESVDREQFAFAANFALDPSGTRIVGTGASGELVLFDRGDGSSTILREGGQFASLGTIRWSPIDPSLLAFIFGGSVQFLNVETGEFNGAINSQIGNIVDFNFAPSGNAIATSSFVQSDSVQPARFGLEIWNQIPSNRQILLEPDLTLDAIGGGSVRWSPDGDRLATFGSVGLSIYNIQSAQIEATGLRSDMNIRTNDFAWSPTGDYIATNGESIWIWDTELMVIIRQLDNTPSSRELVWSPDGQRIYGQILGAEGGLGVFEVELDGTPDISLALTSLCSPDPDTVRVWHIHNTNSDPVDFTWDVVGTDQTGSGTVPGGTEEAPGEVTFETVAVDGSPNTARIFIGGLQDQQDSSGEICNQIPTANTQIIDWSDHGSRLVIVENEQLTIYDQSLNPIVVKNVSEISDSQILWVRLSPSGDRLFVALQFTGVILDSSTLVPQVEFNDNEIIPSTAQWSNDGTEIAFRYRDGLGRSIYATDTGQKLREFYDLDGWRDPYELVWSPNGDVFASFASEHVIILDAQDGSIVDSFDIEEGINDVSWSPDGDEIAVSTLAVVPLGTENSYPTSSLDAHRNSVYILDASDGTTVTTITGLPDGINTVVWSADGSQIAGSDSWRSLYVWDATDGTLLDSFLTRPFQVRFLYFSEYGGRLVVGYGSRAASARDDRDFVPLSTFVFDALGEILQYYVPNPSATRMTDILSRCVTDSAIAAEGSDYIASEQWGVFLQWLDAQPPNILPLTCADDLQLITQVLQFH